jgi:hypothetical protein
MQRELWRNRWLDCINELTSFELQKESWLDKSNSNPHWSFVEVMCCYFDDLGIDNNYEYQLKKNWISENEFEIIKTWHNLLDNYTSPKKDDYDVEAILMDEEWLLILKEGQKAKSELSKLLNEEEIKILNEKIDYTQFK